MPVCRVCGCLQDLIENYPIALFYRHAVRLKDGVVFRVARCPFAVNFGVCVAVQKGMGYKRVKEVVFGVNLRRLEADLSLHRVLVRYGFPAVGKLLHHVHRKRGDGIRYDVHGTPYSRKGKDGISANSLLRFVGHAEKPRHYQFIHRIALQHTLIRVRVGSIALIGCLVALNREKSRYIGKYAHLRSLNREKARLSAKMGVLGCLKANHW